MKQVQKHRGVFTYAGKEIVFHFWSYIGDRRPDTVIFLGAGQINRVPGWVAQAAGPGVVAVDGVPYWHAHPTGRDTADFSKTYVQKAFQAVLEAFSAKRMNIMAESQAAPACVILARDKPAWIRNITLVRPLGFTTQVLGASAEARMREFRRRALRNSLQFSQTFLHDPRSVGVAATVLRTTLWEQNRNAFKNKYMVGISYDLLEDCQAVVASQKHQHHRFNLLLGGKDIFFPPEEVRESIAAAGLANITVEVFPKLGHSSLAVRRSRKILARAIELSRS